MSLLDPVRIHQFQQEMGRDSRVIFHEVALPLQYFASEDKQAADLLFKGLHDNGGCIVLIEQGIRYLGRDPSLIAAFRLAPQKGWRPLAVIKPLNVEDILSRTDVLLGLSGGPPSALLQDHAREVVVPPEKIQRNSSAGERHDAEHFGADLVAAARRGELDPPLFRDAETAALIRILCKEGKNAACLVGESGVGKTKVVEGLAVRIAEGNVPTVLREARLLDVNLSFVAAGATFQNEFEGRMKKLLDEARRDPNVILFLDELHTIRAPNGNASQMVKSDLGRGQIRVVGATTDAEFRLIEADAALARRFQVVKVPELDRDQTVQVLSAYRERLEQHHAVTISDELAASAVDMAIRYVPDRHLPDKALDLLDEACACARLQKRGEGQSTETTGVSR